MALVRHLEGELVGLLRLRMVLAVHLNPSVTSCSVASALTHSKYCRNLFTEILEMDCPFFGGAASKEKEAGHQVENMTFPLPNCLINTSLTRHS